jgi:hypothetical protein
MKRLLVVSVIAAALALIPMAAAADEGQGDSQDFGPFAGASPDSGTCGPNWADDTFTRNFTVLRNTDGTFRLVENFSDGKFVTTGPQSPGACQKGTDHGSTVLPLIKGHFSGFLDGTITGTTAYNQNGCDTPGACNTTSGFVLAVFGPGAEYGCVSGPGSCSFFFAYRANGPDLLFRHWINASPDLGGNRGDIATA